MFSLIEEDIDVAMGGQDGLLFTPTEAAVLTGVTLKAINNAIDKKLILAVPNAERGQSGRLLDRRALLSLALERRLGDRFMPRLRREVFDALAARARNTVSLERGLLRIDLREPRRELAASLRELRRARRLVVIDPEILAGDPVFRGTRVPVHLNAMLLAQGDDDAAHSRHSPRSCIIRRIRSPASPVSSRTA